MEFTADGVVEPRIRPFFDVSAPSHGEGAETGSKAGVAGVQDLLAELPLHFERILRHQGVQAAISLLMSLKPNAPAE